MAKLNDPPVPFDRFKIFAGAPYADTRPSLDPALDEAIKIIVPSWRQRARKRGVRVSVLHPSVAGNDDDGVHRNIYADRTLSKLPTAASLTHSN